MMSNMNVHTQYSDGVTSTIPPYLIKAYFETNYVVKSSPEIVLNIGKQSSSVMGLHLKFNVNCSAFITAFNPYSKQLNDHENSQRNKNLTDYLSANKFIFIEGLGIHPSNEWPGEPSFLVLGMNYQSAKAIAIRYEQNAVVMIDQDSIPKLVLMR